MTDRKIPTFRGTKPSVENFCAKCGTESTAGCWRRGWLVEDGSVNLCNKCGLQFKNGKLDSPLYTSARDDSRESSRQSSADVDEAVGPYTSYSFERLSDGPIAKKVLFYVHDAHGNEKHVLTGHDLRGTGHFDYESVEGFHPSLKCKNRKLVVAWLEEMGASRLLERGRGEPSHDAMARRQQPFKPPPRPTFDRFCTNILFRRRIVAVREYCDFRVEYGKEGETEGESFYLVDAEGHERLVISSIGQGEAACYRCVMEHLDARFDDRSEVLCWLEWVVGKTEMPPYRVLDKDKPKPTRTRESYSSSLAESGDVKRRLSRSMLDEMSEIFGDQDLMRWVLRKPSPEEIETFIQWRNKLSMSSSGAEARNNAHQDPQELLELLQLIQQKETCLKLLEVSSLGRPISALRRHENKEISDIATEITKTWNDWTTRALEKASAARKRNAPMG